MNRYSTMASKEFRDFAKEYVFVHSTSSHLYPRSNGQAARMVQTAKRILEENRDLFKALSDYHNTEIQRLRKSPAQMFLGRRLKANLPGTSDLHRPVDSQHAKLQARQMQSTEFNDRGSKNLTRWQHMETSTME